METRSPLIREEVDIYQFPALDAINPADQGAEITIGDLHGNFMKLLYMLVRHGVVTNVTKEQYDELLSIYKLPVENITQQSIARFNQLISNMTFNTAAKVRLIGDDLADRGSNDYFMLKMFEAMKESEVPFTVLVSNHGMEFVMVLERRKKFNQSIIRFGGQTASMDALQELIDKKLVTQAEIEKIYHEFYKPSLKLIDYSFNQGGDLTIYTHAGVGLETIQAFAEQLGVPFNDNTAEELAQTIHAIDQAFQMHVTNNTICSLYRNEGNADRADTPFEMLLWNRNLYKINRPYEHKGYQIFYAHGHDAQEGDKHVFNLDSNLGKTHVRLPNDNVGTYKVLFTHDTQLALQQGAQANVKEPPVLSAEVTAAVLQQLDMLHQKAEQLTQRGYATDGQLLDTFQQNIRKYFQLYRDGDIKKPQFTRQCRAEFNTVYQSSVARHRGVKNLLLNFALLLGTLGFFNIVSLFRGQSFFYRFDTASVTQVRELERVVVSVR